MDPAGSSKPVGDAAPLQSRRTFLRYAAAVGILGPAAVGRGARPAAADEPPGDEPVPAATKAAHLAAGLVALSRVHPQGWVGGHFGAAVVASHYFCEDNDLDGRTARALRANVDAFLAHRPDQFPKAGPGAGTADPVRIVERLDRQVHELRSGGHDKIFAALALRALKDLPEYATPAVVDGICRLLEVFAATARPVTASRYALEHPTEPYRGPADLAAATLRAMLRPWGHVRQVGTSGVLHWVTHAEALLTLEDLGYGEVARKGYAAHQLVHNRPVVDDGSRPPERPPVDWLGPAYWESDTPRRALDGSWLFGHSFKLPYSLFTLLRRVDDEALRSASLTRAALLSVPFE